MILTDAGPLVAILDRGERYHRACVDCLAALSAPLLTTWPAFTEAMYLLGEAGGWRVQAALWILVQQGDLDIAVQGASHYQRIASLMEKYRDFLMDLADASLVALAEERRLTDIFTLDRAHFQTYRLPKNRHFTVWPTSLR